MKASSGSFHQPDVPTLVQVPSEAPSSNAARRITKRCAIVKNQQNTVLTQASPNQTPPQQVPPPQANPSPKKGEKWYNIEPNERAAFEPTDAIPGSAEKIEVIKQRLKKGLPLWHPQDRRGYD